MLRVAVGDVLVRVSVGIGGTVCVTVALVSDTVSDRPFLLIDRVSLSLLERAFRVEDEVSVRVGGGSFVTDVLESEADETVDVRVSLMYIERLRPLSESVELMVNETLLSGPENVTDAVLLRPSSDCERVALRVLGGGAGFPPEWQLSGSWKIRTKVIRTSLVALLRCIR